MTTEDWSVTRETTDISAMSESKQPDAIIYGEAEDSKIIDVCDEVGATDRWVVGSLFAYANTAVKVSMDKYGNESESIDYNARISAIKEINKMKSEARAKSSVHKRLPFKAQLID